MKNRRNHIYSVEKADSLDSKIRRWFQNPRKILAPYVKEGMTVLDVGCGPGFFSIDMAKMVGDSGRVIASDLQEGMLQKLRDKIKGTELDRRVKIHKCQENKIGVSDEVDFVLLFYLVHEVPNEEELFNEIATILKPDGLVLIVEPPFHVSKVAFEETLNKAKKSDLKIVERPKIFLSKTALLEKN